MGKRLIIAEKPSVGRDIANVLNCIENGSGCRIGENDVVTWAVGHLVGLKYPDELDSKYANWKLEDLPIFPDPFQLKVLDSGEKQFEIVKDLMNDPGIDRIVCATDAGREGELIFRYIYQLSGCSKPVERLWISSLTYHAIKEGFENLKPDSEYDNLYYSAKCRSEADWLIGMNASRAYGVVNDVKRLSIGRVQSPTLAILVERELERRNFIPEEYCEVVSAFDGFEGKMIASSDAEWSRFSVEKKTVLERFVKSNPGKGRVAVVENKDESQPPQQLYDLTSLQRDANRLYGMSSKWTLDTAQKLYERHKAITYPRTDSRYLSSDIKSTLDKRLDSLCIGDLAQYAEIAKESDRDLFGRFINTKGVSDHHAIIPTGEAKAMDTWQKDELRIYDLIARRFIGMFFPDREVLHQNMVVDVDGESFRCNGEKVLQAGWAAVDTSRAKTSQELPSLKEGDVAKIRNMRVRTDQTKPPAPHTEASLLSAMEHAGTIVSEENLDDRETEYGIGTPATRAATIEKLIENEMVVRKGRTLIPTEYGIKLISILPEVLQSPEMTGEWEAKLSKINKGQFDPDLFMDEIKDLTEEVIGFAIEQGNTGIKDSKYVGKCPLCGNPVRDYDSAYYCINQKCEFRPIYKAVAGSHPTLHSETMRELLDKGIAKTERGTYTLSKESPYITFEYAPKKTPDYKALRSLIQEYGLTPVNKVSSGGGFWLPGDEHDEMMRDFLRDCKEIGCEFNFAKEPRALRRKSGWYLRVEEKDKELFEEIFKTPTQERRHDNSVQTETSDPLLTLVKQSGFEYVDKRSAGGSLWIIAGEDEGKALVNACKILGTNFIFTANGSRSTRKRPGWYSKGNK